MENQNKKTIEVNFKLIISARRAEDSPALESEALATASKSTPLGLFCALRDFRLAAGAGLYLSPVVHLEEVARGVRFHVSMENIGDWEPLVIAADSAPFEAVALQAARDALRRHYGDEAAESLALRTLKSFGREYTYWNATYTPPEEPPPFHVADLVGIEGGLTLEEVAARA